MIRCVTSHFGNFVDNDQKWMPLKGLSHNALLFSTAWTNLTIGSLLVQNYIAKSQFDC